MQPGIDRARNHRSSGPVIGCLTIAIQDARVLNIALERIMLGRPMHYLDEQIKQAIASSFGAEVRP